MSEEYESSNRFPADDKLSLSTWTAYNIFHPFSLQLEVNAIFFFSVRVPIKNRRFIIWDTLTTNAAHISSHRCVVIVHYKTSLQMASLRFLFAYIPVSIYFIYNAQIRSYNQKVSPSSVNHKKRNVINSRQQLYHTC